MPFGSTWSEELIAEWLEMKGYLTVINLPVGTGKVGVGGRKQADVVGIKISEGTPEIWHVEVGSLPSNLEENIKRIKNKFSDDVKECVKEYFSDKPDEINDYEMTYVSTYESRTEELRGDLEKSGIKLLTFREMVERILGKDIEEYKKNRQTKTSASTKPPLRTLPESWWLLILLDYLQQRELLNDIHLKKI